MTYVIDMETLKAQETERRWLLAYGLALRNRDRHIRDARRLGVSAAEIGRLIGMSRGQVSVIVNSPGRDSDTAAGAIHSSVPEG